MNAVKQVICINWGARYGAPYINRLYAMVARNITPPFTFTCFTDTADGVRAEVRCEPLPRLDFELPQTNTGIWGKSRLWSAQLGDLTGVVLYLDLDLIITSSIDSFFEYGDADRVYLAHNPIRPLERLGQTSVYRFPVGALTPLLQTFAAAPAQVARQYRYEQRFVTRNVPGGVQFFPRHWIRHFRYHCTRIFPLNYFAPPKRPQKAKIVIFPGGMKPAQAIAGIWRGTEHTTPAQHLAKLFTGERRDNAVKHLRHYLLPTDWVEEAWRE